MDTVAEAKRRYEETKDENDARRYIEELHRVGQIDYYQILVKITRLEDLLVAIANSSYAGHSVMTRFKGRVKPSEVLAMLARTEARQL